MHKSDLDSKTFQHSQRIFAHLLRLYPREYQQTFGTQMAQLFADCSREAARQSSAAALLALWANTLLDVCKTALEERIKEVWSMNPAQSHRRASLLLLAGAAILLTVVAIGRLEQTFDDPLGGPDGWIEYARLIGMPLSYLLLTVGAWQLSKAHEPARAVLSISALGALVAMVATMLLQTQSAPWWLYPSSYLVFLTGLGVFGLGLRSQQPVAAAAVTVSSFLLPVVALIALGFHRYWWSRGGANTGFTLQAGLDMLNISQLIAPALLCIAAILLLRSPILARASR